MAILIGYLQCPSLTLECLHRGTKFGVAPSEALSHLHAGRLFHDDKFAELLQVLGGARLICFQWNAFADAHLARDITTNEIHGAH